MRIQRAFTYRPMLVISKPYFTIQNDSRGIPIIWKDESDIKESEKLWFELSLNNIGLEAARDISIDWDIETEVLRERIDELLLNEIIEK